MSNSVNVMKGATEWIQTASNKTMSFTDPDPKAVNINDIALALARQPRYSGHGSFFYSVAQHSIYAAAIAPRHLRLHALLHDAHEAYTGDIPRPLKELLGDKILYIENKLQRAIYKGLNIEWPSWQDWEEIAVVDKSLLEPEYHTLFTEHIWKVNGVEPARVKIEEMEIDAAKDMFLLYYKTLLKRNSVLYGGLEWLP